MRRVHAALFLIVFSVMLVLSSSFMQSRVLALSGTGAGIRIDGPLSAFPGQTLVYIITVFNLGDFWIRNGTVMDTFPNGTSSFWNVTDLAPVGQLGDRYQISGIVYVVREADVPAAGDAPYITNHAEFVGYSDVQNQSVLIGAQADFLTIITERPAGGYSMAVGITPFWTTTATYLTVLFIATAAYLILRRSTTIAHATSGHRKEKRLPVSSS